jgi:hypothetical protein
MLKFWSRPTMFKDLSEFYLLDPIGFKSLIGSLLRKARPMSQIRQETLSAEARECLTVARPLLDASNMLERLVEVIAALGYAGDPRPAVIAFIGIVSPCCKGP